MFQCKSLFNKTGAGDESGSADNRCKSCGGDLYTHRG